MQQIQQNQCYIYLHLQLKYIFCNKPHMQPNFSPGKNIKMYREKLGYNQEEMSQFLGINRVSLSQYETGEREIPLEVLNKSANLFGIELIDLLESNPDSATANLAFAFRAKDLTIEDLNSIAQFQKVVRNYIKMAQNLNQQIHE